ncbi:type II secretion system protein [Candidatus Peregrinibacteria bacterium]|jgi:type II secretory pathway pseudopilin PulG|nr:type II secretion system protein [Candidatus Peregrinibacteria bacterium]MBT7736398.1 type II secretion system protein [Candidatus Peregrinibacteria bacterium]
MKILNTNKGFTLIEIIFYFAIIGIALTAMMSFALQVMNVGRQSENIHEIQSGVTLFTEKISYAIRTAESIDDSGSTFDNDNGELELVTATASTNPTRFYLSDEDLYIREGSSAAIKLNSATVKCTKLRFQKITYDKAPDQVVVDAEFEPKTVVDLSQAQVIKAHTSVALRQ